MSGFETRIRTDGDAERIRSAFYRFVQQYGEAVEGDAHISTEIDLRGSLLLVRLWSAEALDAFLAALTSPERPATKAGR